MTWNFQQDQPKKKTKDFIRFYTLHHQILHNSAGIYGSFFLNVRMKKEEEFKTQVHPNSFHMFPPAD